MYKDKRRKRFAGLALGATVLTSVAVTGASPVGTSQDQAQAHRQTQSRAENPAQPRPRGQQIAFTQLDQDRRAILTAQRGGFRGQRATVSLEIFSFIRGQWVSRGRQLVGQPNQWFWFTLVSPPGNPRLGHNAICEFSVSSAVPPAVNANERGAIHVSLVQTPPRSRLPQCSEDFPFHVNLVRDPRNRRVLIEQLVQG